MPHATFLTRAADGARRVSAAFRRRRRSPRPEPVATLEPRRMLAAFVATPGDDVIRVFGRPGEMHVVINGVDQTTAEIEVFVNASGGEDTVYLGAIEQTGVTVNLTLRLGAGNDRVTNFDPDTGTGSLVRLGPVTIEIIGDAGTDTIALDDSDTPVTAVGRRYEFGIREGLGDPSIMTFSRTVTGHTTIRHESVEEFLVDAGNGPDTADLYQKPGGMILSVTGGGGDDRFTGGYREFDADGWVSGTTTLSGGTGIDSVMFIDASDQTSTPGAPASLTLAGFTLSKGSTGFTYSGFESVSLLPAYMDTIHIIGPSSSVSGLTVRTLPSNTVNLLAIPAATTVVLDHGVTVNVGNGDLSAVGGTVTLAPGRGVQTNILNINDHGVAAGQIHTLTATGYTRAPTAGGGPTAVVNFTTALSRINVNAGAGADWVSVESSPAGAAVSLRGNGGDDSLHASRGRLAQVGAPVTVDGGPGNDDVRFDNSAAPGFTDAVLTATDFSAAGHATYAYANIESVAVLLSEGGSRTEARSLAAARLSVTGGQGDDVFVVGGGDLDSNFAATTSVIFDGYPGTDRIEYDDRLDTNNPLLNADVYTLDAQLYPLFGGVFLRYDRLRKGPQAAPAVESWRVEQRVLLASDAGTAIDVRDAGSGLRVEANGGDDAVSVHDTPAAEPVVVHTGDGSDSLDVNADAAAADLLPAVVLLARSDSVSTLYVRPGGTLRVGPGAALTKASGPAGSFLLQGVIDLAGGAMVLQGGAPLLGYLNSALRGGSNGGAWNGINSPQPDGTAGGAIHSSLAAATAALDAVGIVPASALYRRPSVFAGQPVAPGDLLLRHTLAGDANLDTRVDARDMAHARAGMGTPSARWDQGDFTYDGRSDARDYLLLRRNLRRTLNLPAAPAN